MFITYNKVRMHDTDMAGILYFANQFRFVHDAWEDLVESEGLSFKQVLHEEDFLFVIVHVEADYLAPLNVGDRLEVHVSLEKVGTSSFTLAYDIFKENRDLVGRAQTVHVTIDKHSRKKIPIPPHLKAKLQKYQTPII